MLDSISPQQFPCPNQLYTIRAQAFLYGNNKFQFGNDYKRWALKRTTLFQIPKIDKNSSIELKQRVVVIRAVATFEPKYLATQINGRRNNNNNNNNNNNLELDVELGNAAVGAFDEREYSGEEESEELDKREKLRRMRISKANKGNTPWNKGRKHSAETIKRIKERTKIAMQSPEVKMKLINLGHAQSKETRKKIGVGVRAGWERRRERLKLQETCYFEWQNLIAEACRRGSSCERELQWDSYSILDKELEKEWVDSVEERRNKPRPKGNKRAPKSPEQRRKISEAISAKWADSGYRDRVCSALSKYYGAPVGVGKKPRRKPSGEPKARTIAKKKENNAEENKNSSEKSPSKKKINKATYKDPLASSKLEMIKNIRAQRAAAELKKTEAFKQAKLLILEAERAAKALEESAMSSPLAHASLLESRKLISQAIKSLNSIENGHIDDFDENDINFSINMEENADEDHEVDVVNGFGKSSLMDLISINNEESAAASIHYENIFQGDLLSPSEVEIEKEELAATFTRQQLRDQLLRLNGKINSNKLLPNGTQVVYSFGEEEEGKGNLNTFDSKSVSTKKWVRGRLVESKEAGDGLGSDSSRVPPHPPLL